MERPIVICHMLQSIDGKATGKFLGNPKFSEANKYYVDIQNNYKFNCVGLGKGTIFDGYDKNKYDFSKFKNANIDLSDYVAQSSCDKGFMAIFDRKGEVIYDKNYIEWDDYTSLNGRHIICVLTEKTPKEYLCFLKEMKISYVFGGKTDIDLEMALKKLKKLFGIQTFGLEGGPTINESFLNSNLIDEISLVICSCVGDSDGKLIFGSKANVKQFNIKNVETNKKDSYIHMVLEK